ncbi:hypothetical protein GCM10022393_18870 [Aquimarina addita]|uniref:DUF302 domain-containing protein n=1 Tax=Aquimarina addita TaxID=870485 RepID=A0ABP6UIU4_9FLAO
MIQVQDRFYIILISVTILLFSCRDDDKPDTNTNIIVVEGLSYTKSSLSFQETDEAIKNALDAIAPISIVAEVNHSNNATSVDQELDSTKVILFGNPALGTSLMQENQLVGLDLPQKLFIFRDTKDTLTNILVGFNNTSYLKARHGLINNDTILNTIETALTNFASSVSDEELVMIESGSITLGQGIITKTSAQSFEDTYNGLVTAIDGNENLRLVTTLDHQANAATVDLELNPTRLVVFGNPNLGTPLMQNSRTTGIDLPQKILVWQDDNELVYISYNDPAYLQWRHDITDNEEILTTISTALDNLTNAAGGL